MSQRICSPIVAAWLACLTILLLVSSATGLFLPPESDFERHALAELDIFDANDSSATRLVILGDSLMQNATLQTPTFSDRLTTAGLDVATVNLAASDRRFSSYRNILDDVLATRPDVIVIQPDLLRGGGPEHEFSIQRRLRTLFPGGTDYSAPYCRSRPRYLPTFQDVSRRAMTHSTTPWPSLQKLNLSALKFSCFRSPAAQVLRFRRVHIPRHFVNGFKKRWATGPISPSARASPLATANSTATSPISTQRDSSSSLTGSSPSLGPT